MSLLRQAATRNYFTSMQVKALIDLISYRKNKIETAVLLHPRTTDQANFVRALKSLDKETDRQDILEMVPTSMTLATSMSTTLIYVTHFPAAQVGASIKRKMRKEMKAAATASATIAACSSFASAAARAPAAEVDAMPAGET